MRVDDETFPVTFPKQISHYNEEEKNMKKKLLALGLTAVMSIAFTAS